MYNTQKADRMTKLGITTILFILLAGYNSILFAQNETDSLKALLKNQPGDTTKVATYLQLYEALKHEQPDEALGYLNTSIRLAAQHNDDRGRLDGLLAKGKLLEITGRLDSALNIYSKTQTLAEKLGNRKGIERSLLGQAKVYSDNHELDKADSIVKIGLEMANRIPIDSLHIALAYTIFSNIEYFKSDYSKSLEFDQKSLDYNKTDLNRRALSFINLSATHSTLKDYAKSKVYAQRALELSQKIKNKRTLARSYQHMGTIFTEQGNLEEAQDNFGKAIPYLKKIKDKSNLANVYYYQAKIHLEKNEQDKAIARYKFALATLQDIDEKMGVAYTLYDLGKLYLAAQNYTEAEVYFLKAKADFEKIKNPLMLLYTQLKLSELYSAMGDYEKAYTYHVEQARLNDSLFNAERVQKFDELEEKFQNAQKQKEIELLGAENEIATLKIQKQKNLRNYLILGAFLLLVLVGVVYNRYQLKNRANTKLRELDTLKTNFFTNISHEFRAPLTLILSPVQELIKQEKNEEKKKSLNIIQRNATVLTDLTNQLLDLSKLEAGELKLQVKKDDFNSFLNVVCASFESLAVAQHVNFKQDIEVFTEPVYFDEDKVQKILNNLLSNAFKFTAKEGKVTLNAQQSKQQMVVSIQDTGMGISQEDQAAIFRRFHQSKTNPPDAAGTGVGLTLSKELALLHNGDITLNSQVGKGSVFTLSFPTQKAAYAENQITARLTPTKQLRTKFGASEIISEPEELNPSDKIVLIVEDNPDLSNHMRSLLKDEFTVKQSANGKLGIEDALEIVPDIIVSDLMMPEVDGVELSNTLKTNEKTSHIPIILLTAKADRNTKLDGLKTGADDFLTKPFDNEELKVRIQNLIAQREKLKAKYEQTLRLSPSKIKVQSPEETFIKRALQIVDTNLSNSEFTVETFQKELGMSRMQLHRKLKALTNFSASEFIRDIRLQRAADLLSQEGLTISEVAYSCGFNSSSYFTQCFAQKFGIPPSKRLAKM